MTYKLGDKVTTSVIFKTITGANTATQTTTTQTECRTILLCANKGNTVKTAIGFDNTVDYDNAVLVLDPGEKFLLNVPDKYLDQADIWFNSSEDTCKLSCTGFCV